LSPDLANILRALHHWGASALVSFHAPQDPDMFTPRKILFAMIALGATAAAGAASAYTAYMKPTEFMPAAETDRIGVELAYATEFFVPGVAVDSPELHALRPDGTRQVYQSINISTDVTRLEIDVRVDGTYRFSTGQRLGQVYSLVGEEGAWRPMVEGEILPEDAETTTLQTVTVAETYASKGWPTDVVLANPVGRLAIRPITHPNLTTLQSGLTLELLFDGAPFANFPFVLNMQGEPESDLDTTFVTDASGRAHLTFAQPGVYVATARHRADAPMGADAEVQSYTTSLTFEVLSVMPERPPEPRRSRRDRRRDRE
jgi:hypothetical protein